MAQKGFKRKLTTIFSADVAGYSRLMGEDEAATVRTIELYRKIMNDLITQHRGRVIDSPGDNLLAEFSSVVDAVQCGVAVQKELHSRNAELPDNRRMEFRIGINLGDVIEEGDRIYGDGVNIAARLEALAEPGGICISKTAFDQIETKLPFGYEYLGDQTVKNIAKPVGAYRVTMEPRVSATGKREKLKRWTSGWRWAGLAAVALLVIAAIFLVLFISQGPSLDPKRVVVAYFENRTGDPKLDPVGGMVADWITQGLSQTGIIYVEPVPPAEALEIIKESKDPVRSLAKETGAGKVVSGSYYLQRENISLHAQIMDVQKGKLLSALDPVIGPVDDPVKAIEPLRKRVMGALAVSLDERISAPIGLGKPPTYEAYREFLEGQRASAHREDRKAIKHYSRAIELDPDFIMAAIQRAYAHLRLGEYAELELIFRKLDKSRDKLIPWHRYYLDYFEARCRGDHEAAYNTRIQMAMARGEPKKYLRGVALGGAANRINRPKEAIEFLKKCDPESGQGTCANNARRWAGYWFNLTTAHHMLGNHEEELRAARRGRKYHPEKFRTLRNEVRALSALGRIKEVNKLIDESLSLPPQRRLSPGWVMRHTAQELRAHGYRQASLQVIERALKWFKSRTEEESGIRLHRSNLASVLYEAEKWEEAQDIYEDLHEDFPDRINYLGRLGVIAARRGDKEEALEISSLLKDIDRPYIFGLHTFWRARIASVLGDKENTVKLLREALAQGRTYVQLHPVIDFEPLQDYPPFKELIKPKG